MTNLNKLAESVHEQNHRWWHDEAGNRLDRNKGELLCLVHSEISEASEGILTNAMDDKLPHRPMDEVEMADTKIRLLDFSGAYRYDLDGGDITVMSGVRKFFGDGSFSIEHKLAQHAVIHMHISKVMEGERKGVDAAVITGWINGALHLIELYCWLHNLDLGGAVAEKRDFNKVRKDHTYEARAQAQGKKW